MRQIQVDVVYLKELCSSCHLKLPFIREVLDRIAVKFPGLEWREVCLHSKGEYEAFRSTVDIPLFPVVVVDGRQFSAGVIPDPKALEDEVRNRMEGLGGA